MERKDWTPPEFPRGFEQLSATAAPPEAGQEIRAHQAKVLRSGVDTFEPVMREFFRDQHKRVLAALSAYGGQRRGARLSHAPEKDKKELTTDSIFNLADENKALQDAYWPALDDVGSVALDGPLGGGLSWDVTNPDVAAARENMGQLITRVNDTTKSAVADQVMTGLDRGYSIPQIALGYETENYPGIQGVFSAASDARAETIARTESAFAFATATVLSYRDAGIETVEIMDGTEYDSECADADGQIWTLEDYEANPIGHPNCTRAAAASSEPATGAAEGGE